MELLLGVTVEEHHAGIFHVLASFGLAVGALFPIVNAIGMTPIFTTLTSGMSEERSRREARNAAVVSALILVIFLIFGRVLLDLFAVSLSALQMAGGLLVGWVGFQMATGMLDDQETQPAGASSIYLAPLAVPLLAGPGAMGVALGLGSRSDSALDYSGFALGVFAISVSTYLIFTNGKRLVASLGPGGLIALTRIFGLLVLAIASEMVFHGIADHAD